MIGREDTKNDVTLTLNMADGSSQIPSGAYPIIPTGDDDTAAENLNEGSVQYFGFVSPASYYPQASSLIGSITIEEVSKDPFLRDIISIDDISFVVAEDFDSSDYNFDLYGALESSGSSSSSSSENVIVYINGFEYTGEYHFMPNGTMMTGASHGEGTDQIIYSTVAESIAGSGSGSVGTGDSGYSSGSGTVSGYSVAGNDPVSTVPSIEWTRIISSSPSYVEDSANAITTGSDGSIYIAGKITSQDPIDGSFNDYSDAFISKYNPDGTKDWTRICLLYTSDAADE